MMARNINEEYHGDKSFSFGGKYRLYDNFDKREVDKALEEMTPLLNSNSTENPNPILQFMFIRKGNCFNLM